MTKANIHVMGKIETGLFCPNVETKGLMMVMAMFCLHHKWGTLTLKAASNLLNVA